MLLEISLLVIILFFAIMVSEDKNLLRAALSFVFMSLAIGILYYVLGYTLLGVVQMVVYSAAVAALLFFIVSVTKGGEEE